MTVDDTSLVRAAAAFTMSSASSKSLDCYHDGRVDAARTPRLARARRGSDGQMAARRLLLGGVAAASAGAAVAYGAIRAGYPDAPVSRDDAPWADVDFPTKTRAEHLRALRETKSFDVLIIGGARSRRRVRGGRRATGRRVVVETHLPSNDIYSL